MEEQGAQFTFQDVLAILKRRLWWVLVPLVFGPIIGFLVSFGIKPVYTSQTFVLVEQQKVPDTIVAPVVTDQLEMRLMTMRDQILSRSNLEPIIRRFGLYKADESRVPMEELVERLRKAISVTPLRPDGSSVLRGFYIDVSADHPAVARAVCAEILSMFMAENLKVRAQRAEDTTTFLAGQLDDAKHKLDDYDAKLAAFKSRYLGQLPTDEDRNLQMLSTLSSQLDAVNQELAQAQQQKASQEALLSQALTSLQASQKGADSPVDLERELSNLRMQLATLEARYTPEYPDVVRTKAQIQTLTQQLAAARKNAGNDSTKAPSVPDTPEVAQMRVALRGMDEAVRLKRAEQARLESEIRNMQSRVQLSPVVEEQYKSLTRDYESALQFYNELLNKKTQAEMATDLELRREGEQFRVMDPPDLPASPSSPNRLKCSLAGLAAGFFLGAALAAMLEMKERFLRTEEDIHKHLDLMTLVSLPDFSER
ncbi:GumC family protein [Pseudacidobacterium ailaaui]|jgi:polysaccharide chain length determinant protein (PEP-CTERM system associated)|uniref:GumC family protein n=1 Tax=Pseudacidobacterium ailaaui TaxID=1382359 RepID=UPI00067858C7|nr:Wzz/FepE/Etk N-terminal domain-containing protein [Pseudacidobacterium ailaaui]MBX6359860.1 lipopolysaccharide biosynthesis protein [Pseudacidobacterium ailaaui]MDI3253469.1 Wzz/FepE/Etk N-terminal domain-containing protein [Bacillota bacterium]